MDNSVKTKEALSAAETVITALLEDKSANEDFVQELQARLLSERREVDRLLARMKLLERCLGDIEQERDDVRTALEGLRVDMHRIRNLANETLRCVTDKASVINLAVEFFNAKNLATKCVRRTG